MIGPERKKYMRKIVQSISEDKIMIILAILCLGVGLIVCSSLFQNKQITQTTDEMMIEVGQELVLKGRDFFDTKEENYEKIVFYTEDVNMERVGLYEVKATFGKQTFSIQVHVQDTKAPIVTFARKYLFTCDVQNTDNILDMMEDIYELSEFTMHFVRFEKQENLRELNIKEMEQLTEKMENLCNTERLRITGTEEIPEEEGIYWAVLEVADMYGNVTYETVVLILDKTGAYIEEVPDKEIMVDVEDLNKEPQINKEDYKIVDNVDGKIAVEDLKFEVELIDKEKHEWMVHVCYIDRAGNESRGDFLVVVKERQKVKIEQMEKNEKEEYMEKHNLAKNQENASKNDEQDINESQKVKKPDNRKNQNENEWKPTDDENDISPWEQKVIDAGYGNVVDFGDGAYGVLTHKDGYVNGKHGGEILKEYLADCGLEAQNISGGVIDEENDWRWYIADNIRSTSKEGNEW